MPKALCIAGMVVAILVLILFVLDMALGVPFKRASFTLDVIFVISAAILGYLSFMTLREQ
jgi:uncharacterized membrane protein